jgi:hypothetical protein
MQKRTITAFSVTIIRRTATIPIAPCNRMSKYLYFEESKLESRGKKTTVWYVRSVNHGDVLGRVRWFGRWRQYTFHPKELTTFNPGCMRDIADFCEEKTKEHRAAK